MEGWKCTITARAEIPLLCFCAIPHNLTTSDLIPNEFNLCLSILFPFCSILLTFCFHFAPFCAAITHNITTPDLIYNELDLICSIFFCFHFVSILCHFVLFCAAIQHNLTTSNLIYNEFNLFLTILFHLCCYSPQPHLTFSDLIRNEFNLFFPRFLSILFLLCPILCCNCTQLHKRRPNL